MLAIPKSGPIARTTMAYVLAGGRGSRLMELTDRRAKPAVYFGCKSRIIDFALSNALNSGIRRIGVATQYKAHSLIRHLQRGWNFFRVERNESFDILPASQRVSETEWYAGTADAVYQNIDIIESYGPDHIIILAGDHVYKMDYEPMLQMHHERQADVTVGCIEVPREEASGEVPVRPASPGCRRCQFQPRLRQGPDPVSGEARQCGGAPLHRVLRALRLRGRGVLARCGHARRLLAGEHRSDRRDPRA